MEAITPKTRTHKPMTETMAMDKCEQIILQLDGPMRRRVVHWLLERFSPRESTITPPITQSVLPKWG